MNSLKPEITEENLRTFTNFIYAVTKGFYRNPLTKDFQNFFDDGFKLVLDEENTRKNIFADSFNIKEERGSAYFYQFEKVVSPEEFKKDLYFEHFDFVSSLRSYFITIARLERTPECCREESFLNETLIQRSNLYKEIEQV